METKKGFKKTNQEIDDLQRQLLPVVQKLHEKQTICFSAMETAGAPGGNNWQPAGKQIEGQFLEQLFPARPDWAVELSKKIADDYQKVIERYLQEDSGRIDLLAEGERWTFGSLFKWSGSIVEQGLIDQEEIIRLAGEFKQAIERKGKDFFGMAHGNVIGDHIFIDGQEKPYLFGMRIVPRPGAGYYDFLRSLDWLLLKNDNQLVDFDRVLAWLKKHLAEDWEEAKLVFALRCIGILGWDMLHRGDFGQGPAAEKIELLLKFIRRNY